MSNYCYEVVVMVTIAKGKQCDTSNTGREFHFFRQKIEGGHKVIVHLAGGVCPCAVEYECVCACVTCETLTVVAKRAMR